MQNPNRHRHGSTLLYPTCTAVYHVYLFVVNNVKNDYLLVPEFKRGEILHLSAGVTLRLYSGNRVWKEAYSHKRAMFCNQIKRRYSWFFLNFVFGLSSCSKVPIKSKTPTKRWVLWQQPGIAVVNTWFDLLNLQHCMLFTFCGLISENKWIKRQIKQCSILVLKGQMKRH